MDEETIRAIDEILTLETGGSSFEIREIPDLLIGSSYITEEFRPPDRCLSRHCREICEVIENDGTRITVECDEGHQNKVDVVSYSFADINFEAVIESVFSQLELELDQISESELPKYISATDVDGLEVYLIVSPSEYRHVISEIFMQSMAHKGPTLLITPEESISELLDVQSLFAGGNLVYSLPFTMLSNPNEILSSLDTIREIEELEAGFINETSDEHPIIFKANSNPRYILTELNHMRLLRISGELAGSSGTRLEKLGESVFSHLFVTQPDSGGEDDRGKNLPDSLFYIPEKGEYDSILGIVDTKSGADAGFGSESVEGKHTSYLKRGRRQSVAAEKLAHVFVILDFDGQQEIPFFDEMSEHYQEDEYMVIITASALAMIMAGYLAHSVSNELKLISGSFQDVIRPFFDSKEFGDKNLNRIVRSVGQNQEEYRDNYLSRDKLLIITPAVVRTRFENCVESPGEIDQIFQSYFRDLPSA